MRHAEGDRAAVAPHKEVPVAVVGGGPAGLAAALALVSVGAQVAVLAPGIGPDAGPRAGDTRTTAILGDGITYLENLGVWATLEPVSAPLTGIRIIDDRGGWLRAPEVLFRAEEIGRAAFGYNVPNVALVAALLARARGQAGLSLIETRGVTDIVCGDTHVVLTTLENQQIRAGLVAAADGRKSLVREAAGIAARTWSYPQSAIAVSFGHTRSHDGISTEFHRGAGPLTTVPLPDDADGPRSSLVWVETPAIAAQLMSLDTAGFMAALEPRLGGLLGRVTSLGRRGTFPIEGLMAPVAARGRIALVGEAAHVLPPIGAQGLNLGFRDGASLAAAVAEHGKSDCGAAAVIGAYAGARPSDLVSREIGIDLLNRALLSNLLPVQAARGLGMHALANSATLRRAAMQLGLNGPGTPPPLMRPRAAA
jgi:2-octaprenyl-6-methoxyphenol hydroxylase